MRTLYQFPLSHFCEKARWVLDYKELDYVAYNLTPGIHRFTTQHRANVNTLPLLNDHKAWIADSTEIALYLDRYYPENNLIDDNPTAKRQIFKINNLANDLGIEIRRWVLGYIILPNTELVDILIGDKGYLYKFKKYSKPMLLTTLKKHFKLNPDDLDQAKINILSMIKQLNQHFLDNGTHYMVQDRFTFADIAVCSMIAPLLNIEGTPWETEEVYSNDVNSLKASISELAIGEYVYQTYKHYRNARVDWRGI